MAQTLFLEIERREGLWARIVSSHQGSLAIEVHGHSGCPEAYEIVHRVNLFPMLVEALKDIRHYMVTCEMEAAIRLSTKAVDAALTAARGER